MNSGEISGIPGILKEFPGDFGAIPGFFPGKRDWEIWGDLGTQEALVHIPTQQSAQVARSDCSKQQTSNGKHNQ